MTRMKYAVPHDQTNVGDLPEEVDTFNQYLEVREGESSCVWKERAGGKWGRMF